MSKVKDELKILKLQKSLPLFIIDNKGNISGINTEFSKLTGLKFKDLQLRRIFSLLNQGSIRGFNQLIKDCRRKKIVSDEFEILQKKSIPQLARITLFLNEKSGCITGLVHIVDNVGQLKSEIDTVNSIADHNLRKLVKANEKLQDARRAEQEALSVKEKFLTNISHELRTPLAGLSGITQLLSNTELSSEQRDYVDNILHSTEHLVRLINDLLDLSKLKSEKFELELQEFSLFGILKNLSSSFSIICENKNITFNFSFDKKIPKILLGDSLRISQVINNLLNNSFKFTKSGYIYLNVELVKIIEQNAFIKFEIKDTGIGIEKERLKSIFDEFQQGRSDISRLYGGTGLGLSISQYLVKLQKGEIFVESTQGRGSSFYFTLPLEIGQKISKPFSANKERLSGIKVLLADDNRVNILVIENILKKEGAVVVSVGNGKEALKKFSSHLFDLFVFDLQMPEMDGYQLTKVIRSKGGRQVPIIAVTAGFSKSIERNCKDSGFTSIIYKPFTNEDFVNELLKFLPNTKEQKPAKTIKSGKINNSTDPDFSILDSISDNKKEVYNDLINTIINNLEHEVPRLKAAIFNNQFSSVKSVIHKIKTSYGYIGMKNELNLLGEAEILIEKKKSMSLVKEKIHPVIEGYDNLINILKKKLI